MSSTLVETSTEPSHSEEFSFQGKTVEHAISVRALTLRSRMEIASSDEDDPKGAWWRAYLEGRRPQPMESNSENGTLKTVDLFCGPGGLANGVRHLADEMGLEVTPELIVDQDQEAAQVYSANHGARRVITESVNSIVDYAIRRNGSRAEFIYPPELTGLVAPGVAHNVDIVLAGPPCQGHSNLNNHTRRDDPRNSLYLTAPAVAVASGAPICIIENVPAVLHDSEAVVETAEQLFRSEGYGVVSGMISADDLGWPQTRKRHFLIAVYGKQPVPLENLVQILGESVPRPVWWAIHDLVDIKPGEVIDELPDLSLENQARIDWLFDNDAYELGLEVRPKSHRDGTTYTSVYGRMRKDKPAPTITTGFMSPGRGRFVHPTQRRVLTAHEAARIQGFPDGYRFVVDPLNPPGRSKLSKWIGDAVPMPLGYAAALSALAAYLSD